MKKSIFAVVAFSLSTVACAQLNERQLFGAALGGLAGSQIGSGSGRDVAIGAGAVLGAEAFRTPPQAAPVYSVPSSPYGPFETASACAGETHIDGVYNPPAAQAYCKGKLEKQRREQANYEREAYRRGVSGQ